MTERGRPRCDSWRGARLPMKPLNAQRTLYRAFSTGREALPMLEELKESIDAIALDGK